MGNLADGGDDAVAILIELYGFGTTNGSFCDCIPNVHAITRRIFYSPSATHLLEPFFFGSVEKARVWNDEAFIKTQMPT